MSTNGRLLCLSWDLILLYPQYTLLLDLGNNMKSEPVIGVIGGMGPAAGVDLVNKITRLTRAGCDQEHLPIILVSTPNRIPDRTRFLLSGEGPNPGNAIAEIALYLESAGATVAGIPCNTAHAPEIMGCVAERLREAGSGLRLINMIDETVTYVQSLLKAGTPVGLLSTTGTRQSRIYSESFSRIGIDILELDEEAHNRLVMDALYGSKTGIKVINPPWDHARQHLAEALDVLVARGAGCIILGCTELPLAVPETEWSGIRLIDPAEILARTLIRCTYPGRILTDQS